MFLVDVGPGFLVYGVGYDGADPLLEDIGVGGHRALQCRELVREVAVGGMVQVLAAIVSHNVHAAAGEEQRHNGQLERVTGAVPHAHQQALATDGVLGHDLLFSLHRPPQYQSTEYLYRQVVEQHLCHLKCTIEKRSLVLFYATLSLRGL